MRPVKALTVTQLVQRSDELQKILDKLTEQSEARGIVLKRLDELNTELNLKMKENTFNKGVVTPLPPDYLDIDNPFVVTPKAPSQVDREMETWEKSLDG